MSSGLLTGPERSLRTAPWMRMSFEPGQSLPATSGLSSSNMKNAAHGWPASNTTLFCHQEEPPELPCTEKAVTVLQCRWVSDVPHTHDDVTFSLPLCSGKMAVQKRMYPDNTKMFHAQRTKMFIRLHVFSSFHIQKCFTLYECVTWNWSTFDISQNIIGCTRMTICESICSFFPSSIYSEKRLF